MRIKISKTGDPQDFDKVNPNFIYNRYDLFCEEGEFEAVKIQTNDDVKVVEYKIIKDKAELGLWLTPITKEELEKLIRYITKKHPNVKKIFYKNGVLAYGKARSHNHFKIVFPETVEEMKSRVSTRTWGKMRRWNTRAEEICGEMKILEYDRRDIPEEIMEAFFKFKYETRNRTYQMTASEYLDRYHVSNCYVVMFGDTVGAMHFSCEQCPTIYCENHAYNPELKELSLGKFMFVYCLTRMVEKKHAAMFLGGGDFEYKKHYGSMEETVYDCEITVTRESTSKKIKRHLKKYLSSGMIDFLKKVKRKLKSK